MRIIKNFKESEEVVNGEEKDKKEVEKEVEKKEETCKMKEDDITGIEPTSPFELPTPIATDSWVGKFVIYQGSPRAVITDLGDMVEILLDAVTGETLAISKSESEGFYESVKKVEKKKVAEVTKVKEDTVIVTTEGKFILESGDRFVICEGEDENSKEDKDEDNAEKNNGDKKEESKADDEKMAKLRAMKEDGDTMTPTDDEKKDPSVAPMAEDDETDDKEKEKTDTENKAEKKEESTKSRKVYTIKESINVKGYGILSAGKKFIVLSEGEDPEALKFELAGVDSPFKEDEEKTDAEKEKEGEKKMEAAKKDKNGKYPFEKGYIKEDGEEGRKDTEDKKDESKLKKEDTITNLDDLGDKEKVKELLKIYKRTKNSQGKDFSQDELIDRIKDMTDLDVSDIKKYMNESTKSKKVEEDESESDEKTDAEKEKDEPVEESFTLKEDAYISGKLYKKGKTLKILKK